MNHLVSRPWGACAPVLSLSLSLLLAACGGAAPGSAPHPSPPPGSAPSAAPVPVVFQYQPGWSGVLAVDVVGAFGLVTDWQKPLLRLTRQADGSFRGTADLPPGAYPYLFLAHGDDNDNKPPDAHHYALDPGNLALVACPRGAPIYGAAETSPDPVTDVMSGARPCSLQRVPQGAETPRYPIGGQITYDHAPAAGYLAVLERDDDGLGPYFTDMAESAADGSYTFQAAPGRYRVQVLHPTLEKMDDGARDAVAMQALRRAISAPFTTGGAVTLSAVDAAYHGYAGMVPQGAVTLPAHFQLPAAAPGVRTSLAVYGLAPKAPALVGAAWFASPRSLMATVAFDGTFTSAYAAERSVQPGERYYLATLQAVPAAPGAQPAEWLYQSMVIPITFQ